LEKHNNNLLDAALKYSEAGLSIIPCHKESKAPTLREWKPYQSRIADPKTIRQWFSSKGKDKALAVICGKVSGNLEVLDFDCEGDLLNPFSQQVNEKAPDLLSRLVLTQTQSKGFHIAFCCPGIATPGNRKLAQRGIRVSGPGTHPYKGKNFTARKYDNDWYIVVDLIETRGEGGYFLAPPSPGYSGLHGNLSELNNITPDERQILLNTALSLNEWVEPHEIQTGYRASNNGPKLPGQDFDERGDFEAVLKKHRWKKLGRNGKTNDGTVTEYWRRPGKDKGHSASVIGGRTFYCFSSSGASFERFKAYSPFAVYALLEHNGDFKQAARGLAEQGYGEKLKEKKKGGVIGVSFNELRKRYNEKIAWVWRQHLPRSMACMINGREQSGKTSIALVIANEVLEKFTEGVVIWVATEGAIHDTLTKMEQMGGHLLSDRFKAAQKKDGDFIFDFNRYQDRKDFDAFLEQFSVPILMVIIDSLRGATPFSENDDKTGKVMLKLNGVVCDRHKATLLYIHHWNKKENVSTLDKSSGSTAITSAVRIILSVIKKTMHNRTIKEAKNNITTMLPELESVKVGNQIMIYERKTKTDERLKDKAEEWLIEVFKKEKNMQLKKLYRNVKSMVLVMT